jgi:hypothetical protein
MAWPDLSCGVRPRDETAGARHWRFALAAREGRWDQTPLNDAFQRRTTLIVYLDALARDGAMRCDLEGNAVEPASPEHRQRAIEMKAERLTAARKGPRP